MAIVRRPFHTVTVYAFRADDGTVLHVSAMPTGVDSASNHAIPLPLLPNGAKSMKGEIFMLAIDPALAGTEKTKAFREALKHSNLPNDVRIYFEKNSNVPVDANAVLKSERDALATQVEELKAKLDAATKAPGKKTA